LGIYICEKESGKYWRIDNMDGKDEYHLKSETCKPNHGATKDQDGCQCNVIRLWMNCTWIPFYTKWQKINSRALALV